MIGKQESRLFSCVGHASLLMALSVLPLNTDKQLQFLSGTYGKQKKQKQWLAQGAFKMKNKYLPGLKNSILNM